MEKRHSRYLPFLIGLLIPVAVLTVFSFISMLPYTIPKENTYIHPQTPLPGIKLYLCSSDLGQDSVRLKALTGENRKAVVICNAVDHITQTKHRKNIAASQILGLKDNGYEAEEVDLRDYFNQTDPQLLRERFKGVGLIWASGGNTFILRRAMAQSGFDTLLPELLQQGVVYGGFSAGAVVATPTLHGIEFTDDPYNAPSGYQKEPIWQGMGLTTEYIIPHYREDSSFIQSTVALFEKNAVPYQKLADGEVFIVEND